MLLLSVCLLAILSLGATQDCSELQQSELGGTNGLIADVVLADDNPTPPSVTVNDFQIVCLAAASTRDRYRFVSVVVDYDCSGNPNCILSPAQFDFQCSSGSWIAAIEGASANVQGTPATGTLTTTRRTNCSYCFGSSVATTLGFLGIDPATVDAETHCAPCDSSCIGPEDNGLNLCTGVEANQCCNVYETDMCTLACSAGFEALNGECVVSCGSLSDPTNGNVDVTGTYVGSNATYTCDSGFILVGDSTRMCQASGEWSGAVPTCDDVDECDMNPCMNGGTCVNNVGSFTCNCIAGYMGDLCGDDVNECSMTNPCMNGGTCMNNDGSFTCNCSVGYMGDLCGDDVDECSMTNPCMNGGTCVNNDGSFTCDCSAGYIGDLCGDDVDECSMTNPCMNGGTCVSNVGSFTCDCSAGYMGDLCGDVDCGALTSPPNGAVSFTTTTFQSQATYTCDSGYTLDGEDERTCNENGDWTPSEPSCAPTICITEFMDTIFGSYSWPNTTVGDRVDLRCELGSVSMEANATRMCGEEGVWMDPDFSQCTDTFDLLEDMNINSDNYEQVISETSVSVEIASANPADQNEDNIAVISSVLDATAVLLVEDPNIVVDVQTVNETVEILDILQEWNATVVALESANIVQSFESIVSSYALQENFTELVVERENLAFVVERLEVQTLIESGRGFSLAEDQENGTLNVNTEGGAGNFTELAPDELANAFLPPSLFTLFGSTDDMGVFFSLYRTAVLFPLGGEAQVVGPGGADRMVGSPVVAATVAGQGELRDLPEPVSILLRLNNLDTAENITAITCVSYDFDAADGRGNWTSEGCVTEVIDDGDGVLDDGDIVSCSCNHLTNFAVLVDICSRTGSCGISSEAQLALDVISIIGVVFSLIGIIVTIFTLLVFKKLRQRDATKYHIQLCIALFCMLLVFVIGIDQNKVSGGCVTVSILIHYFTLVAVMWMGAEATLMFQKLVIIFVQITTRYIVILSMVCWLVPIIPAVIPAAIDWEDVVSFTDSGDIDFCFIGNTAVFFGAFLGPILAVMAFNLFIMCIVVFVLIRHIISIQQRKGEKIDMKIAIRLLISITGVMFLFGLTWVFGALTVAEASLAFQILFALFNSFQGFFIFLFFVVFSKDARQAWKEVLSCAEHTSTTLRPSRAKNTSSNPVLKSKSTTATLTRTGGASSLPQSEAPSGYDRFAELAAFEPGSTSTFSKSYTEKETNVDGVNGVKEDPEFELEKEKESLEGKEKEALQQAKGSL